MIAASWGEPEQYQHAIVNVLLTVSSNGTEPGSILLPAKNYLGICLSLLQRLQLPLACLEIVLDKRNISLIVELQDYHGSLSFWQ